MILYALTILVSAFLLFQVQPIIAKIILPWFGGSAAVWTVCLLFFQLALLAGYSYAHALVRYCKPRAQMFVHVSLLLLSVLLTGQALRAGRPMLVVPFAHDQPDNAARVRRLGVARVVCSRISAFG